MLPGVPTARNELGTLDLAPSEARDGDHDIFLWLKSCFTRKHNGLAMVARSV